MARFEQRYRFGIIFNFERNLRQTDPTGVFKEVDHLTMLTIILEFLTDDVISAREGFERVNEIDYLMDVLTDKGIIKDHEFAQAESYLKITGILFAICEGIVSMFSETGFYYNCRSYELDRPKVLPITKSNFAIVVRPH